MKYYIYLALMLLAGRCAFAQNSPTNYEWNVTIKVIDENGSPVARATASVGYYTNSTPASMDGETDINGRFMARHSARTDLNQLGFDVEKAGYYSTRQGYLLEPPYDPLKWNPTVTLVLKKVEKPIAMYAKFINKNPPVLGQPVGYDLMIGDWVGSNGKGVNADIIFQKEAYRKSGMDYEYKEKVTFPKPGDGIQIYTIPDSEKGSGLRSPHEAPLEGYQPELNKERSAHPGQPTKNDYDPSRIYFFRVRTVKDHEGNIVSAHYGKIYGDFMQFSYYLNSTPNDRNIEFDLKQNLLGGLDPLEQVTAP
jgi:hypothetical protein